jgi:hypothetical protein
VTRTFEVAERLRRRRGLALLFAIVGTLCCAAQASATALTAGDVVIYRVGSGSEPLTSSATSVFLDEYEPSGGLATSLAFPTTTVGANKALVGGGAASSEGLITLSGNGAFVLATGYNAAVGTANVSGTKAKTVSRTIGRVNASGQIDTTTSLTDFANENNPRSATSSEGTKIWVGGAGTTTTGGVHFANLGASTSTVLNETDTNVRQVEVANGQLYTSADPTKQGTVSIATVGTGLPTIKQTVTNLPFATPPAQPYAYSLLSLGIGPSLDTLYVADNKLGGVAKYGLVAGKWLAEGSVEVPFVTGVTTNDVNGVVTIYATSSGSQSLTGTLYKISDVSGFGGTLAGIPVEIATASANEAFRGVAFAPGTIIGSGGTPPPAPTVTAAENSLAAAIGDPTNQTLPITVEDSAYAASELTLKVKTSNPTVAPVGAISLTGTGSKRTLAVTPAAQGTSKLTLTVEAPDGSFASTQVSYGASLNLGNASDRYYEGAGNASSAIDVGGGYMILGDDETNVLHLYRTRTSGEPVKSYDFTSQLPFGTTEMDIEASARSGNTIYWMGSLSNKHNGEPQPARDVVFAATISGSGATTELTYLGSYTHLREDLTEWDNTNGKPLGLAASAEIGAPSDLPSGFNVEGLEFAAGSSTTAYVAFRAPQEPPGESRTTALLVPVTNFSTLATTGNPGTTKATFGAPLEWNLGGLGIREIRKNANDEYLVIAGAAGGAAGFGLYGWDGEPEDEPVLLNGTVTEAEEGAWEDITSTPSPIANGDEVELIEDNGDSVWYGNGLTSKNGLAAGLQKDLGRLYPVQIPPPGVPGAPALSAGQTPNSGQFTLHWKPAPTLRAVFNLEHQNAQGGWSTVATGLTKREYTFTAGGREAEGTWTYRVTERNESGENGPSAESGAIKVDHTPPPAPTPKASRAPDYAGGGGWYKDNATVSFTANGDPVLADGSAGSGIEPSSLSAAQTFTTSGTHTASGTVADKAGNVSAAGTLIVHVDATAPSVEVQCPASALVGEGAVTATVTASDGESGLASDPSGVVPISTAQAGPVTVARTAIDNVGHETSASCTTQVHYPTPGAPALTTGTTPNDNGLFTLGWTGADPLQYLGLRYALQHHDAAGETWTEAATGIEALSYEFTGAGENEGTWVYRVQGSDPGRSQLTEYSPPSAPVVVDRTPPNAPTAKATRALDYAGGGGWFKDSVTVAFTANGDPALSDGSAGSGVEPSSLSASQTFKTSGTHIASGTVADNAGNVSQAGTLAVHVDATPPSVEVHCPATALVGEASITATVTASDGESGLASNPSGTVHIGTTHAGSVTVTRTAIDNVEHETTSSCTTVVGYPTPGAPALSGGANPNANGLFTLDWSGADPLTYPGLTYTLQHHNAATATWSAVATGIEALSYAFAGEGEPEGTWVYRVKGTDPGHGQNTEYSPASAPVVVDRTAPHSPTATASRAPDYAGEGGWYKNSVTVSFTANGDPALKDGSPGSGIEGSSLTAPQTFTTSGAHTASGTVADKVGNVSSAGTLDVQVDATPPSLEVQCPATAFVGEAGISDTVIASDGESGLASDPSGIVPISSFWAIPVTVTRTAIDNVGHETTSSCTTQFKYPTPGAPTVGVGQNPNNSGLFTLEWTGADPLQSSGLAYTLQHHNAASAKWSTVAGGIEALSFSLTGGGEAEGTWVYRVQGFDSAHGQGTEFSSESAPVVVDRTPPPPPTAKASRPVDYSGGGGWFKDSVTVAYTANGDPVLSDGSPGSGVDPSTLTAPQTFTTSGTHLASGTVVDRAGNASSAGTASVQVDATAPTLEVQCPASAFVGDAGVAATVTAADGQSGLASDPSGSVPIDTSTAGPVPVTRTAIDNVGHETTKSCTTQVLPLPPVPAVTKLSAKKGAPAGGTSVTITGANFIKVSAVTFGSVKAASFTVISTTTINVVAPANTAGTANVTVTNPGGTSAINTKTLFKYSNPTVTSVSPPSGTKGGHQLVSITGTGFAPGSGLTTVLFGKTPGTQVSCSSITQCTVMTPAAVKTGAVDVVAAIGRLKSKKSTADLYTYN